MSDWKFRGEVSCVLPKFTSRVLDVYSVLTKWKKKTAKKPNQTPPKTHPTSTKQQQKTQTKAKKSKPFFSNCRMKVAAIICSEEKGKRREMKMLKFDNGN